MGHPCDATSLTPRAGNRRSFQRHWVGLFLAPNHPRVCGEQDRDQYSRTAEDEPSPGGDRGGLGAWGPQPGQGGLCPLRPVRAPACPDRPLGALPGSGNRLPAPSQEVTSADPAGATGRQYRKSWSRRREQPRRGPGRSRIDPRFPLPGVKEVASYGWPPYKEGVAHVGDSPGGARF